MFGVNTPVSGWVLQPRFWMLLAPSFNPTSHDWRFRQRARSRPTRHARQSLCTTDADIPMESCSTSSGLRRPQFRIWLSLFGSHRGGPHSWSSGLKAERAFMSTWADAATGAVDGLKVAGVLFVMALPGIIMRSAAGEWRTTLLVVPVYVLGGCTAGGIVGALRKWTTRWLGAIAVGFIAGYPVGVGVLVSIGGLGILGPPLFIACGVTAMIWSLVAGTMIWSSSRRPR